MEGNQKPEKGGNEGKSGDEGHALKTEGEGKTVSEAEANALEKLEELAGKPIGINDVELTVVTAGSKGFLGVGSSLSRVEARLLGDFVIKRDVGEAGEQLREYLEKVVAALGLEGSVEVTDEGEALKGNVSGEGLGIFIGRHGQTIDAVQYLANVIVYRKQADRKRIIIDAEDYRERRTEALQAMADRGASEVLDKGRSSYELKSMNSAERRIVHVYLQDRPGVETASEGEEPNRRVVINRAGSSG